MALWEYKVITSGPHGFASPTLLEAHLNALGKDEWEIIHFQTLPNNALAFHGLARRSTTRDWAPPEAMVVTAPKTMAWEQPPTPVVAKPAAAVSEEKRELPPALVEAEAPKSKVEDTKLRTVRDTERDLDPDAQDEDEPEDWDKWEEKQDELPTLFEAIKPHLRRNQRGPGMSVAVDYLAKRWDQKESDIVGALKECGFTLPETEEAEPDYFEFEGDLYWVNRNNRGQFFLNTREKPRPTFRVAPVTKLSPDDPAAAELVNERALEKAEIEKRNVERAERLAAQAAAAAAKAAAREQAQAAARERAAAQVAPADAVATTAEGLPAVEAAEAAAPAGPTEPLPTGSVLLDKIRPLMRRNRRGPGYSGSVVFLARALKTSEADFVTALAGLGLNVPANAADKPIYVEIDGGEFWVNKDSRGGIWINGQEKRGGAPKTETTSAPGTQPTDIPTTEIVVAAVAEAVATGELSNAEHVAIAETVSSEAVTMEEPVLSLDSAPPVQVRMELSPDDDEAEVEGAATEAAMPDDSAGEKSDEKTPKSAKKPARPRAPRRPKKTKE
ncbi:MAG: hypothetical protein IPP19_09645 [Verrucomicrobia bacterium]|nr:hypothetical protein [Verrucomicrobiota bacterium]